MANILPAEVRQLVEESVRAAVHEMKVEVMDMLMKQLAPGDPPATDRPFVDSRPIVFIRDPNTLSPAYSFREGTGAPEADPAVHQDVALESGPTLSRDDTRSPPAAESAPLPPPGPREGVEARESQEARLSRVNAEPPRRPSSSSDKDAFSERPVVGMHQSDLQDLLRESMQSAEDTLQPCSVRATARTRRTPIS